MDMFDRFIIFLQENLVVIVLLLPFLGLASILIGFYYMNSLLEYPETNVTQEEIQAAIDDDPNVESSKE